MLFYPNLIVLGLKYFMKDLRKCLFAEHRVSKKANSGRIPGINESGSIGQKFEVSGYFGHMTRECKKII